ncbi:universal stress protein PHOS32-like [Carya illinoinensis]|uniref:universal stress protein PHOS32-like n=1 Tax=Carya illinoinensis TaxID=32201 RepID=UPI001C71A79D|nr:universal stress protein PHOS32-like [Carya illinoinensis]
MRTIDDVAIVDEDGTTTPTTTATKESEQKLEDNFNAFTTLKAVDLARPLREVQIPYKIHIVKDHNMRERLCLEVERLGLNAVIMGSRGFGAARGDSDGKLNSVSDYCVHHCVYPVVMVRYPDDGDGDVQAVVDAKEEDGEEEKNNRKG